MTTTRNSRRSLNGVVSANGTDKTITVVVERTYKHPRYGKFVRRKKKYLAHDEKNEASVGDKVEIVATRPLSKRKRWRLGQVLRQTVFGADAPVAAEMAEKTALETLEVTAPKRTQETAEPAPDSPEASDGGES